ncbi:MAG: hypothetical protein EXS42_09460 [Lacunisphaera sp.]|nr:hypothetical protein [Lacunisphaera sp.]
MKKNSILKTLILAAVVPLGLATSARAADTPVPVSGNMGLLGQTYASLTYSYLNLDRSPTHADSYGFDYNQSLNTGLDGILSYNITQAGLVAGARFNQQMIGGALRAFNTSHAWGKPYVEAGVGYAWTKFAGSKDNSVVWSVTAGAELQIAPAFTVTPFVSYVDAPDLTSSGTWNFGVKANYWVDLTPKL